MTLEDRQLSIVSSHGIAPNVVEHFRMNLDFGIAGWLRRETKLLRRTLAADTAAPDHDPQVVREFELLGAEVAVPMFDTDQLLGVLAFSGKVPAAVPSSPMLRALNSLTKSNSPLRCLSPFGNCAATISLVAGMKVPLAASPASVIRTAKM